MSTAAENALEAENTAENMVEPTDTLEALRGIIDGLYAVTFVGLAIYKTLNRRRG